ncbi:MAG: hypothetical protein EA422_03070 [Gemmatimonadales bacterium]|nr:MAG: hypothetical protein EA422_03070 [Gemmatimonadales bacterium]
MTPHGGSHPVKDELACGGRRSRGSGSGSGDGDNPFGQVMGKGARRGWGRGVGVGHGASGAGGVRPDLSLAAGVGPEYHPLTREVQAPDP